MPLNRLFTTFVPLLPFLFFLLLCSKSITSFYLPYMLFYFVQRYISMPCILETIVSQIYAFCVCVFMPCLPPQYIAFYFCYTTISCLAIPKEPVPCGPFSSHVPSAGCGVKCLAIPHIYLHTNQKSFN